MLRESDVGIPRGLGLATMTQNNVIQGDAAPVMSVRARGSDTPKRPRQELSTHCGVPIAFVETRAQVVPLEVREYVFDYK